MLMSPVSGAAGRARAPARHPVSTPGPAARSRQRVEWPPERLARLRALFEQGLSHALIAGRMGAARGAISGKIARLGWRRGETAVSLGPASQVQAAPAPPVLDPARMKRLEQLAARECHWPTLEDADGVQLFCGCRRPGGQRYCPGHQARAFRAAVGWERRAVEPADRRAPPREGLGWERFGEAAGRAAPVAG